MKLCKCIVLIGLASMLTFSSVIEAGGMNKAIARSLLKRSWAKNIITPAKPLSKPRTVFRYSTAAGAKQAQHSGLSAGRHMTSVAKPGRPVSAATAQRRYGLPNKPEVRMTIRLPKKFPAKLNKVEGGGRGLGQLTSKKRVPPEYIRKFVPIR